MPRRQVTFSPDEYFHLYNRGVNRGKIFFDEENYSYFIHNIKRYLLPILDITAYCLMPTHYHLLVCVNPPIVEISEVSMEVSKAMMKLSVSYTKAINHRYDRVGPLFQGAFQAKHIGTMAYLWQLTGYIHLNPIEVRLVKMPE